MYKSTKSYGHQLGLSACFRQWRALSHCRLLHGYPLAFKFTFGADELDENNWVMDFGGLSHVKKFLVDTFDHKLVIAADDPQRQRLENLGAIYHDCSSPVADVLVLPSTGCEAFAAYVFAYVECWLKDAGHAPRVRLISVECREHGGNSAIYEGSTNVG